MSKERRRIDGILELVKSFPSVCKAGLPASVGLEGLDDCAVVPVGNGFDLIIGSDFVRGEEFHLYRAGMLNRQDIGYFLIGANASDLAAMGAAARWRHRGLSAFRSLGGCSRYLSLGSSTPPIWWPRRRQAVSDG